VKTFNSKIAVLICSVSFLAGCTETPQPPSPNGGAIRAQNEGYSLLYKLMSDNGDVDKIFILKHADESVSTVVKDEAAFCQETKKKLDELPRDQSRIEFDVPDLPKIEQASRDLEASYQEKKLLGSSGKEFELKLIFTQAQAMGYASQLAAALQKDEPDETRKQLLGSISARAEDYRGQLMRILIVK
jgi:hypothetical protein